MLNIWLKFLNKIYPPKITISGACKKCGKCCENLILTHKNKAVTDKKQVESLKKKESFYSRFTPIYTDPTTGIMYFSCALLKDKICSDHNNRPNICRNYPSEAMFAKGGKLLTGCGYILKPQKDFEQYLKN